MPHKPSKMAVYAGAVSHPVVTSLGLAVSLGETPSEEATWLNAMTLAVGRRIMQPRKESVSHNVSPLSLSSEEMTVKTPRWGRSNMSIVGSTINMED
jgi:hypothetical protein